MTKPEAVVVVEAAAGAAVEALAVAEIIFKNIKRNEVISICYLWRPKLAQLYDNEVIC